MHTHVHTNTLTHTHTHTFLNRHYFAYLVEVLKPIYEFMGEKKFREPQVNNPYTLFFKENYGTLLKKIWGWNRDTLFSWLEYSVIDFNYF